MFALRASGNADDRPAGVHVPIRRTHARKGGHDIHSARIGNLPCIIFRIAAFREKAEFVPQPLDHGSADKDATFQRVFRTLAPERRGNRRQKSVFTDRPLISRIHQEKAARSVRIFRFPLFKAALSEQRRLLIARYSRDRYSHAAYVRRSVNLSRTPHFGQHFARNIQNFQKLVVPFHRIDVEQHRPRSVRAVGDVYFPARQLPYEPRIHRAEQQLAAAGAFPRAFRMI